MKRLLGFLLLFLLAMRGLSVSIEEELHGAYEAPLEAALESPVRVVLLGDSRAWMLDRDALGPGVVNLAYPSDGTADMNAKLRFLLRHEVRPDLVFLQCDWHMLSRYRSRMNNRHRGLAISSPEDAAAAYGASFVEHALVRYVVRVVPLLDPGNAGFFQAWLAKRLFGEDLGPANEKAVAGTGRWDTMPRDRARARIRWRYAQFFTEPWDPELAEPMEDLVRVAREQGIRVVGLRFPVVPEFQALTDAAPLGEVRRFYESLGIEILDFEPWFREDRLFRDQDHLNPEGATRMAGLLRRWLDARCAAPPP
ncbi:MAG: hypothetical protein FJ098_00520 [Deltaproteobacteria bacterium]|nr:hypothetical protein [Deltaproteobacteria bacterium]